MNKDKDIPKIEQGILSIRDSINPMIDTLAKKAGHLQKTAEHKGKEVLNLFENKIEHIKPNQSVLKIMQQVNEYLKRAQTMIEAEILKAKTTEFNSNAQEQKKQQTTSGNSCENMVQLEFHFMQEQQNVKPKKGPIKL